MATKTAKHEMKKFRTAHWRPVTKNAALVRKAERLVKEAHKCAERAKANLEKHNAEIEKIFANWEEAVEIFRKEALQRYADYIAKEDAEYAAKFGD